MAAVLRGTWVSRGAESLKWKGKSKLANILFERSAARGGDATTFAVADVRPPAQSCKA